MNGVTGVKTIPVRQEADVVAACQQARVLAERLGFSKDAQVVIIIAVSEVGSNIVKYAQQGEILLNAVNHPGPPRGGTGEEPAWGISIVARDAGPGIADIAQALQDGYSTGNTLGLGLASAQRLMDTFDIVSTLGKGTEVRMIKWKR